MRVTASKRQADLYNILDEALKTGVPVEVVRKGRVLKIVPETKPDKLSRLKKRDYIVAILTTSSTWIEARSGARSSEVLDTHVVV